MKKVTLYRYEREAGKITVSTSKPDCEYTEIFRLIADDGKVLTNGNDTVYCMDTELIDGWSEVEEVTDEEYAEAGKILLGG